MLVSAALCPAPPLLIRELTGVQQVVPELRRACLESVAELATAVPDVIAVVGPAERTGTWNGVSSLDLTIYAPPIHAGDGQGTGPGPPGLPAALGVGAWLLGQAGCRVSRVLQSVADDEPASRCAEIGARLANSSERVALLVMGDGSARRSLKAPGYLDERSRGFDAQVERAIRVGRLGALLSIDPALARDLMATGRPAWQVLAGALEGHRVSTEVRYSDDPFGVAYLVASFRV